MHHGVTPLSPNPSLPVQTHPSLQDFLQKQDRYYGTAILMAIDWNRVRRVDSTLSEEEREELLERLNEMVENYRSLNADVWVDPDDD